MVIFLSRFLRGFVGRTLAVTVPEMGDFMSHLAIVNASMHSTCLCRVVCGMEEAPVSGLFHRHLFKDPLSVPPNAAG